MTVLKVPGMHCQVCVTRINNTLTEAGIAFEVDLDNHTVSVEESKVEFVTSELEDLGFMVET